MLTITKLQKLKEDLTYFIEKNDNDKQTIKAIDRIIEEIEEIKKNGAIAKMNLNKAQLKDLLKEATRIEEQEAIKELTRIFKITNNRLFLYELVKKQEEINNQGGWRASKDLLSRYDRGVYQYITYMKHYNLPIEYYNLIGYINENYKIIEQGKNNVIAYNKGKNEYVSWGYNYHPDHEKPCFFSGIYGGIEHVKEKHIEREQRRY